MEENKHSWANSIGAIVGAIALAIGGIWYGGQLDAQIKENKAGLERIAEENKAGFAEIKAELTKLRDSETNKELGILKVRIEGLEKDKERIERMLSEHSHNSTYIRKEDYQRDIEKIEEDVKEKQ